ncbi:MAG: VIT domain-containing protein [Rhodocyclaceae bacterium]|nr:VIT domain-containing protein [Rhodocyclaceae bacterium]
MRHDQIGMMSNDEAHSIALKGVNVAVTLAGLMAETHLEQRYCNDSGVNLEIAYTFPLPVDGVLLHFEIELNGKAHTGHVVARKEAEKEYEATIEKGDAAFRLQKLADGLFNASLGNIKSGEEVIVRLVWVETLSWNGNAMRYRLPTTLAPRYGSPDKLQPWQRPVADTVVEYPLSLKLSLLA